MSFILSSLAQKKIEKWNKSVLTLEDGEMFCYKNGVRLINANIQSRGEYTVYKKIPFIILRDNLNPNWKNWVLWHEIAHHILHYPGSYLFSASSARKIDFEANFVAAIALLPLDIIGQFTVSEIIAEFGYPKEIIKIRKLIYDNYRI